MPSGSATDTQRRRRAAAATATTTAGRRERDRAASDADARDSIVIDAASISRPYAAFACAPLPVGPIAARIDAPHMSDELPRRADFFVHPQALCESAAVGANTR